jgi:hypothetical protein
LKFLYELAAQLIGTSNSPHLSGNDKSAFPFACQTFISGWQEMENHAWR